MLNLFVFWVFYSVNEKRYQWGKEQEYIIGIVGIFKTIYLLKFNLNEVKNICLHTGILPLSIWNQNLPALGAWHPKAGVRTPTAHFLLFLFCFCYIFYRLFFLKNVLLSKLCLQCCQKFFWAPWSSTFLNTIKKTHHPFQRQKQNLSDAHMCINVLLILFFANSLSNLFF